MGIQIDKDGSIINGDETIASSGTIIRDDGTIETTNIGGGGAPAPVYVPHTPPESPLNNVHNANSVENNNSTTTTNNSGKALKTIADLEYELMVVEGKAKNAISRESVMVCIICTVIGFFFPLAFIGTVIAGIKIFKGNVKKSEAEEQAANLRQQISNLKNS